MSYLENVEYLYREEEKLMGRTQLDAMLSMRCMAEAPEPKFEASETSTASARGLAKTA